MKDELNKESYGEIKSKWILAKIAKRSVRRTTVEALAKVIN
jgi:hypothetical protein